VIVAGLSQAAVYGNAKACSWRAPTMFSRIGVRVVNRHVELKGRKDPHYVRLFQPSASSFLGLATSGQPILCHSALWPVALRNNSIHLSGIGTIPGSRPGGTR
jgi:hypothetical protein